MNGLTLLVVLALVIAVVIAWRVGVVQGRREQGPPTRDGLKPAVSAPAPAPAAAPPDLPTPTPTPAVTAVEAAEAVPVVPDPSPMPAVASAPVADAAVIARGAPDRALASVDDERMRIVRSLAAENADLRRALADAAAERAGLTDLAEDRRRLFAALATVRAETARYRTLVIDLENNAPPPLLDGPSSPDDLKLIVGVGPVLERMLQQMGITTYRQIARWSERDIVDYDARLAEFPGRIRRDAWVTQARALHQSKYGETLPARDR